MFGRHARLPVETAVGAPPLTQRQDLEGWVHQHHQTLQRVYRQVAAKTRVSRMRDKARYDQKTKKLPLLPGERVLLCNFRRREQGKLAPHWQPQFYVVIDQLRPGLPDFQIKPEGKEGPIRTIHRNHLRPCLFNPPEDPPQALETEMVNPKLANVSYPGPLSLPLTFVPIACAPPVVSVDDDPVDPIARPELRDRSPLRRSQRQNKGRPPDRYGH